MKKIHEIGILLLYFLIIFLFTKIFIYFKFSLSGYLLLEERGINCNKKFGFHVPPWNSINHLHYHCFRLPITNCFYDNIVYGCFLTPMDSIIEKLKIK